MGLTHFFYLSRRLNDGADDIFLGRHALLVVLSCFYFSSHWMFLSLFWFSSLEQSILFASLSMLLLLRMSSQSVCSIKLNRSATQWAVSLASGSWSQHSVMVSHRKCIPWNEQAGNYCATSILKLIMLKIHKNRLPRSNIFTGNFMQVNLQYLDILIS